MRARRRPALPSKLHDLRFHNDAAPTERCQCIAAAEHPASPRSAANAAAVEPPSALRTIGGPSGQIGRRQNAMKICLRPAFSPRPHPPKAGFEVVLVAHLPEDGVC